MSAKPWHRSDKSDLAGSFFLETEKIIKQFGPNCLMIFFVSTATTREAPWPHTSMTTVQVLDCTNKTNLEADVLRWRCPRGLIKRTSNHGRSDFGPCDPYSECSYTPCRDLSATLHLQSPPPHPNHQSSACDFSPLRYVASHTKATSEHITPNLFFCKSNIPLYSSSRSPLYTYSRHLYADLCRLSGMRDST